MSDKKQNNLSTYVMSQIKKGNVKMRTRIHFVLVSTFWILALLIVFGVALFLVSFVVFVMRGNGIFELTHFGASGFSSVIITLPWLLLFGILLLVAVLELLAKHFAFVYRRPLVYSILGIIILIIIGGVLIGKTQIHDRAFERASQSRLSFAGPIYEHYGKAKLDENIHIGVLMVNDNELILETREGDSYVLNISDQTRKPPKLNSGMEVFVLGRLEKNTIEVKGIKPVNKERFFPQHRAPKPHM